MIPNDKPIWEFSKKEFAEYCRHIQETYDDNVCLRDLLAEFKKKKPDLNLVYKLAKQFVHGMEVEDIGEPPKTQPRNRKEAMAEMKRGDKNSVLSKRKQKHVTVSAS